MTEETLTIFRKFKDEGDIIALFPEHDAGNYKCSCYQQLGQHDACDYQDVVSITTLATPGEYAELKAELERIGYTLRIRKRWNKRR